jgi:glycine cleavage system H protein
VADRQYTETHEWVSVESGVATIGITDFAQAQLGDVVFLELPKAGAKLSAGDAFGVIESVKAASDLYSPVEGSITEVNEKLRDNPELVNREPEAGGWLIRVQLEGGPPAGLLDQEGYKRFTEGGH